MSPATMPAWVLTGYGGPEQMRRLDVPVPAPGPGEVRVRVRAAGLNPVDYKIREGLLRPIQRYPLPIVLGNELAGSVDALGTGVERFTPGQRVFARVGKHRLGAFATHACVDQAYLAPMPQQLDFEHAAGLPLAGLTALQALRDELQVGPGFRLLIAGGAGGVGTLAIPLAKWLGAEVITTASPRGQALVRSLGADRVVDYTTESLPDAIRDADGALDLVGGDTLPQLFRCVRRGGLVVSIAGTPEPQTARQDLHRGPLLAALFWLASASLRRAARRAGVRYRYLFMHPDGQALAELAALVDAGRLPLTLDRVFEFDALDEAFAYLERGHAKGKVVVRMP